MQRRKKDAMGQGRDVTDRGTWGVRKDTREVGACNCEARRNVRGPAPVGFWGRGSRAAGQALPPTPRRS